jgi:lambda family phage portal protein
MSRQERTIQLAGKDVNFPVTLVDRIVDYFDPVAGAKRYMTRARMALSGGYTAADKSRRANQRGSRTETDADGAILPDLQTLRDDSQHLNRNSPLAAGAIKTNVTKVVGTGLKVKAQIDRAVLQLDDAKADAWERAAEREFLLATESIEIDVERQLPFSLLQGLAFLKTLEDGDILVNLPRLARAGSPYKLKLQLIEAARLCNKDGAPNTATLCAGVKKDPATGAPTGYQVASKHPGSLRRYLDRDKTTWTELDAFGKATGAPLVLHLFDKTRPGQTRGVPYLAPVMELIKQLGRYTDAEVMAAVVSGMVTAFVTTESGDPTLGDGASENTDPYDTTGMELGAGTVIGLTPNTDVKIVNPGRPNTAFDPFVMAILRQIGVALELPFELLVKHFTASYSAARAALEEACDYFSRRRHWLVVMLCQPVYEAVITEAVATGRLSAPGFFSDALVKKAWLGSLWSGDAYSQIDPVKEIEAAERRVALRITTRAEECTRLTGGDLEGKLPQMVREERLLRAGGLLAPAATAAGVPAADKPEEIDQ